MSVDVNDELGFALGIDLKEVSDLARFVLDRICMHLAVELNVLFEDEESMARLHVEWMDLDRPMDAFSFPMGKSRPVSIGEEPRKGMLEGIVVCPQVAVRQVYTVGHAVVEEVLLLVTHGALRPLGYDHVEEDEQRGVFDLQRQPLLTFLAGRRADPAASELIEV